MIPLDKQITQHNYAVSLEAFEGLSEYVRRFSDIRLFANMKTRVASILNVSALNGQIDTSVNSKVIKWLTACGYPNLNELTVYVPISLDSTVCEYLSVLEDNAAILQNIIPDLITPSCNLCGMLLNDPELLKSSSGVAKSMVTAKLLDVKIETLTEPMAKCFDKKKPTDVMGFQKAYARIADFDTAARRVANLQDGIGRVGVDNVKAAADSLFDIASNLAKEFKTNTEYRDVSKKISNQLAEHLFTCAQWIELYGVFIQQVNVMAAAIRDTETKFNKLR